MPSVDTPCVPKTWNISDDLGQIEYVFSDKTGTLTQNIMEFKKCSINGVTFGEGLTEAMMGAAKRDGRDLGPAMAVQDEQLAVSKEKMLNTMKASIHNRYLREDKLTLIAPELPSRLADVHDPLRPHVIDFFRALAICHSVLADAPEPTQPFVLDYKAESPDEAALVAAARDVGFPFVTKNNSRLEIEVLGRTERWVPLRMLEFNSSRKRMSVIARDPQGRIVLFCKGADSVIYERLAKDHDPQLKAVTLKDLETFANGGLRTLCIARRYMEEEEFDDWSKKYDAACAAVLDRENEIERTAELIEHSLTILGATALEDKLQEGVPDAIAMLHRAGIKLWILTGDKLQTAIEIGYSCNLLTNDMEVMIISADSEEGARAQIEAGINKIASVLGPPTVKGRVGNGSNPNATFAVVIDGDSLRYALQPGLKSLFLSLGTQCSAVICCRVSPSQKALTVRLVSAKSLQRCDTDGTRSKKDATQ
jgi:phospholipid-translocating ATPase